MVTSSYPPRFAAKGYDFLEYAPAKNWIGGEWRDGHGQKTIPVENPRFGKAMSNVPISGAEDVDLAVKAAQKAFQSWKNVPLKERAQVFFKLKELMERDLEELSWLVSHE